MCLRPLLKWLLIPDFGVADRRVTSVTAASTGSRCYDVRWRRHAHLSSRGGVGQYLCHLIDREAVLSRPCCNTPLRPDRPRFSALELSFVELKK
jgi:hypothetical protein